MEKLLKSKSGIAAILVIIILVVAVGAGGAAILAVRMVVTGEDYLQPFVDLGWIRADVISNEEIEETVETSGRLIELSSDMKAKISAEGVTHYEIELDAERLISVSLNILSDILASEYNSTDEYNLYILEEVISVFEEYDFDVDVYLDLYVDGNDVLEVVLYVDYGNLLEVWYEFMQKEEPDLLEKNDIESYDDFVNFLYSKIDEDEVAEQVINAIIEVCGNNIDYTEKELKELITFKWNTKNNELELAIEIPDEVNEGVADFVDENWDELIATLEEYEPYISIIENYYGFSIVSYDTTILDEDEYVESIIYFCEDLINSLEDGIITVTEK